MMKKILLSLCFYLPLLLSAQTTMDWGVPFDEGKKQIIYEGVIMAPGASKDELFSRVLKWIENYYTAGLNKITKKSKEEGFIELKDRLMFFRMEKKTKVTDVMIDYNMSIYFKDGKVKYEITNFRASQGSTSPHLEQWMEESYPDPEMAIMRFANLHKEIQEIIEALTKDVKSGEYKKDDDW